VLLVVRLLALRGFTGSSCRGFCVPWLAHQVQHPGHHFECWQDHQRSKDHLEVIQRVTIRPFVYAHELLLKWKQKSPKRIPLPKLNVAKPSLRQIECYCHFRTTIIEETTVRSCKTCGGGFQTRGSGLGGTNGLARNRSKHTRTSQNSHLCSQTTIIFRFHARHGAFYPNILST
jgi:hypothetical protein